MAIGALHVAARRGLRVPDELSVVGFDGIDAARWSVPELTTVEQPIAQIADTAVQTLQTLIEQPGRPLPNSYFRPVLRVRASTAPLGPLAQRRAVEAAAMVHGLDERRAEDPRPAAVDVDRV
jgi:DNA-binding LacI/PurR family transcriptional regulator